ncbi:MAG: hypothetical protein IJW40_04255 [Clostridia bacterium]|nr:hypothetical protein [Clostridia bacterium]
MGNIRADIGKYTIVRPDATDALKDPALLIRTVALDKMGVEPTIVTDYVNDGDSIDAEAPEILIGNTARPESATAMQQLPEKADYLITQVGNKICIVGHTIKDVISGVNEFLSMYFNYQVPDFSYHNVRDYGASGDGVDDDSLAFKKAVKAAEADGLPVYVPAGTYLVTETITLNSVTLYGYNTGSWTADDNDLPTVYHNNLEEPLFNVCTGSLSGLNIVVQGVNAETTEAAETIMVSGVGSRVNNLRIYQPYIGIKATYNNTGRSVLDNILIVFAWNTGVDISGTWDIATLQNIEVWNPDQKYPCPYAFRFGKNDALHAANLFTFNAGVGFDFYYDKENDGGCWGTFENCGVDLTSTGIYVGEGNHHLTFNGGTYWGHWYGMDVTNKTDKNTSVTITGAEFRFNGGNPISINGGHMITVTGCNVYRIASGHSSAPVKINGGHGVTIVGNTFSTLAAGVEINSGFTGAANVTANTILSSSAKESSVIVNRSTKATVNTEGNVILIGQTFD